MFSLRPSSEAAASNAAPPRRGGRPARGPRPARTRSGPLVELVDPCADADRLARERLRLAEAPVPGEQPRPHAAPAHRHLDVRLHRRLLGGRSARPPRPRARCRAAGPRASWRRSSGRPPRRRIAVPQQALRRLSVAGPRLGAPDHAAVHGGLALQPQLRDHRLGPAPQRPRLVEAPEHQVDVCEHHTGVQAVVRPAPTSRGAPRRGVPPRSPASGPRRGRPRPATATAPGRRGVSDRLGVFERRRERLARRLEAHRFEVLDPDLPAGPREAAPVLHGLEAGDRARGQVPVSRRPVGGRGPGHVPVRLEPCAQRQVVLAGGAAAARPRGDLDRPLQVDCSETA